MALTPEQRELRRKGIGASDARTIAHGGPKDWKALYDEKINGIEPVFKADQQFLMDMGTAIEPLTLRRFNNQTKPLAQIRPNHVVHWKIDRFFLFSPDGITLDEGLPVQTKFHTGDKNILELADYYMPQLLHEMLCMGTRSCWIAVSFGHYGRYMAMQVPVSDEATDAYLQRAMEFKLYMETGKLPEAMAAEMNAPKIPRKRDHVWSPVDNEIGALAMDVIDNFEQADKFTDALKKLKEKMPKDAATATWARADGQGIKLTANRAGAISWTPLFPQ